MLRAKTAVRLMCALTVSLSLHQHTLADIELIITSGMASPDGNGTFSFPNAPTIGANGHLSFVTQLTGTSGGTVDDSGLYRYDSGGIAQIAREGQSLIGRTITFFFPASVDGSGTLTGIPALSGGLIWYFKGDGGALTSLYTLGSPSPSGNNTLLGVTSTAVNDAGVGAFRAVYSGASPEAGIYLRANDGTVSTLLKQQTPAPRGGTITNAASRLTINESAEVASLLTIDSSIGSVARVDASGAHELVRQGDVLTDGTTTITQFSSSSSFTQTPVPVINDAGQVAFPAQYSTPASRLGAFVADDTSVRLVTTDPLPGASAFTSSLEVVGLSNAGGVALIAEFGFGSDPASGIYLADEMGTEPVALEDTLAPHPGKFFRRFFNSAISANAAGQIAFLAELSDAANSPAAGEGMYFFDPQEGLQEIIRTGDLLGGSVVTNLLFFGSAGAISNQSPDTSASGFNDAGTVAFAFDLANGQSGIAVWTSANATGDYDGDGDVDGRDFLVWQRGGSPDPLSLGDLELWQGQYGTPLMEAISVPEPSAMFLVALSLMCQFMPRRTA